ncbi:MAG: class A beta-lactamase-related serine hydrolase [Bifidobacteriaceae bacterium]|jgi:beta-lactamase class A|nr:class A beta-lactamase-related serine hydrolase [Bifidobacteriaceae bacterium]
MTAIKIVWLWWWTSKVLSGEPSRFATLLCTFSLVITSGIAITPLSSTFADDFCNTASPLNQQSCNVTFPTDAQVLDSNLTAVANKRSQINDSAGENTSNKWQELEQAFSAKYKDESYAIYAEDLNNSNNKISVNAENTMQTASVYKLAVAYSILKSVANGTSWDLPLLDTTLAFCFDQMIIESDNECAHAWGDQHGWQTVTNEFNQLGLDIDLTEFTTATATDIAEFLKKVYHGEVLNETLIEKLLTAMSTQQYRLGIPTGASGARVADKVGFMGDVLNDAGIVFGTNGDYVLVIFTDGYSWESIAETAKLINSEFAHLPF